MRRWMIWGVLTVAAGLLGGSAIATPMSDDDYGSRVAQEADLQNLTCSEIEYLSHVFDEMTGRCPASVPYVHPPPPADNQVGLMISAQPPFGSTSVSSDPLDPCGVGTDCLPPYAYSPPRLCPDGLKPTYRLSPEMYASLGTAMRNTLAQAGVPWDVDVEPGETRGRSLSGAQIFFPAPINTLARELEVAGRLRNCRAL